jgi:FkbM family methyltransferase
MNIDDLKNRIEFSPHPSQLGQELFVLSCLEEKKNGYFVEFGATDGIELSNTLLLERSYGWSGILSEPARIFKNSLFSNRSCIVEDKCVYTKSNELVEFVEIGWISTIAEYSDSDFHGPTRNQSDNKYHVSTITLDDLLDKHDAPEVIDYLSMDTEGSELDILKSYSFSRHINVITVEHNYSGSRKGIYDLLTSNGFVRMFKELSDFDDWYVNNNIRI